MTPATKDPFAVIRAKWIAECEAPGFRIHATAEHVAALPTAEADCGGRHTPASAGTDARGWTRYVCGVCGRFYGFLPPEMAAGRSQTNTRR